MPRYAHTHGSRLRRWCFQLEDWLDDDDDPFFFLLAKWLLVAGLLIGAIILVVCLVAWLLP
jgi:hypothetical protein